MIRKTREAYLKRNINKVSVGVAAHETGLTKETVRRKWRALKEAIKPEDLPAQPKELDTDVKYVFIPELRAKVRLKKGVTPEMYLARIAESRVNYNHTEGQPRREDI